MGQSTYYGSVGEYVSLPNPTPLGDYQVYESRYSTSSKYLDVASGTNRVKILSYFTGTELVQCDYSCVRQYYVAGRIYEDYKTGVEYYYISCLGGSGGGDTPGGGGGDTPGGGGGDTPGGGDNPNSGWSDGDYYYASSTEGVIIKFYRFSTYWGEEMAVARDCIVAGTNSVKGKITIPSSVKGYPVTKISTGAFVGQDGLTELAFPSSITKVEDRIVYLSCSKLNKIICEAKYVPAVGYEGVITPLCNNIVLYVPQGCKNLYKQCTGWKDFGSIKEIGEEETVIQINATNFPDEDFRNFLLGQDYGADGVLTEMEINNITYIQCIAEGIGSLKGIEYFTSLTDLYCSWNSVKSLDLSKNTKLKNLECAKCGLTTLDLSQNTALKFLDCSLNSIKGDGMDNLVNSLPTTVNGVFHVTRGDNNICTKAQVAAAKARGWTTYSYIGSSGWEEIWVEYGGVEQNIIIDATNFPDDNFRKYLSEQDYGKDGIITEEELKTIRYISVNSYPGGIVSLQGIEFFTALEKLDCNNNQITSLDLSKNTALTELTCIINQLASLNVSNNTALKVLDCLDNQLTSLDVSNNTALKVLDCSDNQLTSLDVSKNTALKDLGCSNNQLVSLDISKNTALTRLSCGSNQLASLNLSKNTALENLWCTYNQLTLLDLSKNTALIWLDCYDNKLSTLDISKCTALTWLCCQTNQLTSLDVSNNTALTNLNCNRNQIISLDVSRNTALTYLGCADNQLTSLDVSKSTSLTNLYCPFNKLTLLDVSKNTALTSLHCERNELTKLDVSNNTDLKTLYVDGNQIWGDRMDALITSLPQARYNDNVFNVVYNPEFDANVCTTIQVEAAMVKGWNPTYWNGTPYSGSDPAAMGGILMDGSYKTPIYNLNGQRLDKPRKGINIVGGKKVFVK